MEKLSEQWWFEKGEIEFIECGDNNTIEITTFDGIKHVYKNTIAIVWDTTGKVIVG